MRLADLNPSCVAGPVVQGLGTATLSFDCPRCGPPNRIAILVGDTMQVDRVWKMTMPTNGDLTLITVGPSINNHYHARMVPCGWHGSIVNGEILLA